MDRAVAAEDESGRTVFRVFESILNFYLGAAAPKAINYFGRQVWMKQRSCDHEEEETFGVDFCGTGTLACAIFCNQTHLYWPGRLASPALIGLAMM